jgi:hypothetical protein
MTGWMARAGDRPPRQPRGLAVVVDPGFTVASPGSGRLTPFSHAAYHPPDDDAPCAFGRQARLRAFRGQ